jgi:hypothetical protein
MNRDEHQLKGPPDTQFIFAGNDQIRARTKRCSLWGIFCPEHFGSQVPRFPLLVRPRFYRFANAEFVPIVSASGVV